MIDASWHRIAGLHLLDDGVGAAVWLAHDRTADTLHLYDACLFQREVMAVIAEGLNARGRWVPVAWPKSIKELSEKLLERGCNMTYEPADDSDAMTEVHALDIQERMRTGRFKVDKRLKNWTDEFATYFRQDAKVPKGSFPLMSATRHAVAMLDYAKRQAPKGRRTTNFPRVSMI